MPRLRGIEKMTIYTKKGDKGLTSIIKNINGKTVKISKASILVNALGALDEANSYLGIITSKINNPHFAVSNSASWGRRKSKVKINIKVTKIEDIQRDLFSIGSILAGAAIGWDGGNVGQLEQDIDKMTEEIPVLTGFILPGGTQISSHLMYTRTLVRKAERRVVGIKNKIAVKYRMPIIKYLNRLSDYLFVLARWINYKNSVKEVRWER